MICTRCGFENEPEARFCSRCGRSLSLSPPETASYYLPQTPLPTLRTGNPFAAFFGTFLTPIFAPFTGGFSFLLLFFVVWLILSAVLLPVFMGARQRAREIQKMRLNPPPVMVPSSPESSAEPPPDENPVVRLEGDACAELDSIVKEIGASWMEHFTAQSIASLSKGHAPPDRSARMQGTFDGGFAGKGEVAFRGGRCSVATYSPDKETKFEARGDGSDMRIVSDIEGAVAKVYAALLLPDSGAEIPEGTVLRREAQAWVSVNDPEAERHLDSIAKAAPRGHPQHSESGVSFEGVVGPDGERGSSVLGITARDR